MADGQPTFTPTQISNWLTAYVAQLLGVEKGSVDPACPFEQYGLDSSGAVGLSGDLGDLVGHEFEVSLAYDYPTINALVEHLVSLRVVTPG